MAIQMEGFRAKAEAAKEAQAAKEREEAERVQAEQEAKGREGEMIGKELEAASQEFAGVEASLAEAQQFADTELANLAPEDQEVFRAQVASEQQHAEELRQKMAELQVRKEALESSSAVEKVATEPEQAEQEPEMDIKAVAKEIADKSPEDHEESLLGALEEASREFTRTWKEIDEKIEQMPSAVEESDLQKILALMDGLPEINKNIRTRREELNAFRRTKEYKTTFKDDRKYREFMDAVSESRVPGEKFSLLAIAWHLEEALKARGKESKLPKKIRNIIENGGSVIM